MAIYIGTNKGGDIADLAEHLNAENSTAQLNGEGYDTYLDSDVDVLVSRGELNGLSGIYALSDGWNTEGYKEIKIEDTSDELIVVNNFVDVYIDNQSEHHTTHLDISNVKRANIDTGVDTNDVVDITVRTNGGSKDINTLDINTGSGDDAVYVSSEYAKSSITGFNIDVGSGDDLVDISGLYNAKGTWIDRYVSGGEGTDVLKFNEDKALHFDGFEVLIGTGNTLSLQVGEVVSNANADGVLVLSGFDLDIDFFTTSVGPVDGAHGEYLDSLGFNATDFEVLTANIDGTDYTLLVDHSDMV